jgi:putative polyketide hydroxylase
MVRTAAGLPARGVEVKLRPRIPGTDLKVLEFNIGAQVARGSTMPAGRVFLAGGDSARIINPPTGGLDGNTGVRPGRPRLAHEHDIQDLLPYSRHVH